MSEQPRGRKILAASILLGIVVVLWGGAMPASAYAQAQDGPVVDVVEIAGIIDRPIERYILEQIADAERRKIELLVLQIDSLGGLKLAESRSAPEPALVGAIASSGVPIAIHVGPRQARAAGVVLQMLAAADVGSAGPSTRLGPYAPIDLGAPARYPIATVPRTLPEAARDRNRTYSANEALRADLVDLVTPSVADLLTKIDGREVTAGSETKTLALPKDAVTIRFLQPGPIRRLLHTFSNPTLAFIMLIAGALLIVFEPFQPGFGVAGVTGGLLAIAAAYGFTALPVRALALAALLAGLALLTLDVIRDAIGPPTIVGAGALLAGSIWLYPGGSDATKLSPWVIGLSTAAALIVFVPVMTVVRRARHPMATQVKRALVGEAGEVRSMLNPEGFALVDGEIWRARSEDGSRMRVGEPVVVASVDGTLLIVRSAASLN